MHVHLPKPLHGWREFLGEVGIIVVGVLIALGGEQTAEYFHQRAEPRDAEDAMVAELRDDDLPQAFTRAAIYHCYADQLDGIESAVLSGDREKVLTLAKAYHPIIRTWDDLAWQAALASQVLVHSGSERTLKWSTACVMIPHLAKTNDNETDELSQLGANFSGRGPLSGAQQDRLLQVISMLQRSNIHMTGESVVFMRNLHDEGLELTASQKAKLLGEAWHVYGQCVRDTRPDLLNMKGQVGTSAKAAVN